VRHRGRSGTTDPVREDPARTRGATPARADTQEGGAVAPPSRMVRDDQAFAEMLCSVLIFATWWIMSP
jgi:hypothetical protein